MTILAAGLIFLAAIAAYRNAFTGPFVFDDVHAIVQNRTIRQLWPIGPVLSPPRYGETVSGRPLLNLTFAINYALGEFSVWGYHAVNLAIHIAAALLLMGILWRTFLLPVLHDRFGRAAAWLAVAAALLWTVHPLQTESVTYIVQRAESLAGLFYLLTLYCVIRGAGGFQGGTDNSAVGVPQAQGASEKPGAADAAPRGKLAGPPAETCPRRARAWHGAESRWYLAAIVACLLGMATKEVLVTAPLIVLLYDRTFLAGSFQEAWRRRWGLYVGLAATWALLACLVLATGLIGRQPDMGAPNAWGYARSQPGIVLHYLRLAVWPSSLCLGYGWPEARRLGEILPAALMVGLLLAATVWGTIRRTSWGFLGAWFFLILAPTSSIFPLGDLACEHRMYLPLAAVIVLVAATGYVLWDAFLPRPAAARRVARLLRDAAPLILLTGALLALGRATLARNWDYRSFLAIAQDAVDKSPHSAANHNNLGNELAAVGKTKEAMAHYTRALKLEPRYFVAHNNLGSVLFGAGRTSEAIDHFQQALRLKPDYADAHNNLASVLAAVGRTDEALHHYREALRYKPEYAEAHYNAGLVLARLNRIDEAIGHYRQALQRSADDPDIHVNLAMALAALGKSDEAIVHYQEALRLNPALAPARCNLARILAALGRTGEAIKHYDRLLQQQPDCLETLNNLAWLLATREAAHGDAPARAVQLAQRACQRAGQENPQCLDTLAAAYAAAGRFDDAVRTAERAAALAQGAGQTVLAKKIRARQALYRAAQPYRELSRASPQAKAGGKD